MGLRFNDFVELAFAIAALLVYGVPALLLLLTHKSSRGASWTALCWSLGAIGLMLITTLNQRQVLDNQYGGYGSLLVLIPLLPSALIAWWGWWRLEATEPAAIVLGAPGQAGHTLPIVAGRLVSLWIALHAAHGLLNSVLFASLFSRGHAGYAEAYLAMAIAAGSELILAVGQWFVLRPIGVRPNWIVATLVAAGVSRYATAMLFSSSFLPHGRWRSLILMLAMAIVSCALMAPAQWFCLPRSLSRRSLWLIALPAAYLSAALLVGAQSVVPIPSPFVGPLFALCGGALAGAITGAALREMLSKADAAAQPASI